MYSYNTTHYSTMVVQLVLDSYKSFIETNQYLWWGIHIICYQKGMDIQWYFVINTTHVYISCKNLHTQAESPLWMWCSMAMTQIITHVYKGSFYLWHVYPSHVNIWLKLQFWYLWVWFFDTNIDVDHRYHSFTYIPHQQ